jgi:hypothetical protein
MPTALQIITRAAQALKYLGRGEQLTAADANDALSALNAMLDSWSGENLASFANVTASTTVTINDPTYTVGSGGNIDMTRPDGILQAWIRDASNLDYPLTILPQYEWNRIGDKNITSQIPTTLFYDPQYPLGTINLFPIPLIGNTLYFNAIIQQTSFSTMTHSLSAPPGYERAYVLNLAVEMMSAGFPCMLDEKETARLYENASEAKANIKRKNIREVIADMDPAVVSRSAATWNIYSDGWPRR